MQSEEANNSTSVDLIDLSSSTNDVFQNDVDAQRSDHSENDVTNTLRKQFNAFLMSSVASGQIQDKFQKLNLGGSSSNQSNMSCETVKMRDIHVNNITSTDNLEFSNENQKLVSFDGKYSDISSESPVYYKDKRDTDGESSEISFECQSLEKFRMTEDHSFIHSSIIDQDLKKVEGLLEGWTIDLKKKILAEFSQSKIRLLEYYRQQIAIIKEKHDKQVNQLQKENDSYKELAKNFEKSLIRKDELISNLNESLDDKQDKMQLLKYFCSWKIKHNEADREKFATNMAIRHHHGNLTRKVLKGWHAVADNGGRNQKVRSSQVETEELIAELRKDYEDKLTKMNKSLEQSRKEIDRLNQSRDVSTEDGSRNSSFKQGLLALDRGDASVHQERNIVSPTAAFKGEKMSRSDGARNIYANLNPNNNSKNNNSNNNISNNNNSNNNNSNNNSYNNISNNIISQASQHYSLQTLDNSQHDELTYFSDPNPPIRKNAIFSKKHTTLHFPIKNGANIKPKQVKVISAKRTNNSITSNLLGNSLSPPITSVVVERHHPINKETIGQALACRFPVEIIKSKATLKKRSRQIITVFN